jgi:hypothetical protein
MKSQARQIVFNVCGDDWIASVVQLVLIDLDDVADGQDSMAPFLVLALSGLYSQLVLLDPLFKYCQFCLEACALVYEGVASLLVRLCIVEVETNCGQLIHI